MSHQEMNVKRFHLVLNADLVLLTREKLRETRGNENISQFVNELLEEFVLTDRIGPDPIRQEIKALAEKKRLELISQRKLMEETTTEELRVKDYKMTRETAIRDAAIQVLSSTPGFDRWRPENDLHGDLIDYYFKTIDRISQAAGYDVSPSEVEQIWKSIKNQVQEQIRSRAGAIRQEGSAPGHQTPVGN